MPAETTMVERLRRGREMPDGPVSLWIVVFGEDDTLMGASPATGPLTWLWRDGRLCLAYGAITVRVVRPGWYACGVIGAVSEGEQVAPLYPMWQIGLGKPQQMRVGDHIHILDGVVAITPDEPPGVTRRLLLVSPPWARVTPHPFRGCSGERGQSGWLKRYGWARRVQAGDRDATLPGPVPARPSPRPRPRGEKAQPAAGNRSPTMTGACGLPAQSGWKHDGGIRPGPSDVRTNQGWLSFPRGAEPAWNPTPARACPASHGRPARPRRSGH
jgi:hypothetical protein